MRQAVSRIGAFQFAFRAPSGIGSRLDDKRVAAVSNGASARQKILRDKSLSKTRNLARGVVCLALAATLAACGGKGPASSFDSPSVQDVGAESQNSFTPKLASLLGLKSASFDEHGNLRQNVVPIACPEIVLLEGDAAKRVYAGGEANNDLRYQISIDDAARECGRNGDKLEIRVGMRGKVLLGPKGNPGTFNVQGRVAIFDEGEKQEIFSKTYHATVTIPPGRTEGSYTLISDVLQMPFHTEQADQDYAVKIGVSDGSAKKER